MPASTSHPRLVILDHDGGVDDYISTLLLLTFPDVEVMGITVTPGDCYVSAAVSATRKILDLAGASDIAVSAGELPGRNPFPRIWRNESFHTDALPILNEHGPARALLHPRPGHQHLADLIAEAPRPVSLLVTGPLTQLAWVLDHYPDLEGKIERLYWMGGALHVPGNVREEPGVHDGSAEWNAYWDPLATARVWASDVPITLVALDVTDQVPVTRQFLLRLAQQRRFPLSDLAGQIWAGIAHNPRYCFWDTLATAVLDNPNLVRTRRERCTVVVDEPSAGRTMPCTNGGREVDLVYQVDIPAFHTFLLTQLAR